VDKAVEELSILLFEKKMTLATAESCTGGMLAAAMTARGGSSAVFDRGFITYSNISKCEMLGVDTQTIEKFGAVSGECAAEMASGALKNSQADIAVSITGIAGPSGGSEQKPVGLVYIGIGTLSHHAFVEECLFHGTRDEIRKQAAEMALSWLLEAARTI
jgi:nicotinamide-nucleotide amidase